MGPELLAPAGNWDKLQVALRFGADAVYVGGKVFGLRKYAENFTNAELDVAIQQVHAHSKKIYVVLNGFAHDRDLVALRPHLDFLNRMGPDAVIVSDWAVAERVLHHTNIPLHVSTQASVTHWRAAKRWVALGAKRIILARETTLDDCRAIKDHVDTELEVFIHGAMCASYSGKCVISNYSAGRDSNRGGCVQSCRHSYRLHTDTQSDERYMMNARDLMGIDWIEGAIEAGVTSFKIEGRMKSTHYVANACQVYRHALTVLSQPHATLSASQRQAYQAQLSLVSNRTFSAGGFNHLQDGLNTQDGGTQKSRQLLGLVHLQQQGRVLIESRSPFTRGQSVRVLTPLGEMDHSITELWDIHHRPIEQANPGALVWMPGSWESGDVVCC